MSEHNGGVDPQAAITIRFARPVDFEVVRRHFQMVHDAHAAHLPATFRPMEADDFRFQQFLRCLEGNHLALVAERDGQVLGSMLATLSEVPEWPGYVPGLKLFVWHVVTEPAARRQGVAQMLIAAAAEWAAEKGADSIELTVWWFNEEADAFYRKLGFSAAYTGMVMAPTLAVERLGAGRLPQRASGSRGGWLSWWRR